MIDMKTSIRVNNTIHWGAAFWGGAGSSPAAEAPAGYFAAVFTMVAVLM